MAADLIVYALVAAGLVFWLKSILGTRNEDEPRRPNPLMAQDAKQLEAGASLHNGEIRELTPEERLQKFSEKKGEKFAVTNKTAEAGLLEITRADREFDIEFFLDGAQEAFAIIVEAFAAGDRETLKDLLGETVYKAFEHAIEDREKRNHKQETQIRAIRKMEVIESTLRGRTAKITIRFTADETSVTRDENSNILHGHPEKTTLMKDIWTFSRDIKSRDPRWLVVETRGDFQGDNDLIPNSN